MTTHYNFIEVCAGCGGLSTGFINSGFQPLLINDIDKICCETLQLNHPNANIICESMTDLSLNYNKLEVDLLMGGIPCQSYSQAGKRKGLKDERGELMFDFAKIIKKIEPKIFLIENVKGLINHNNGKTLKTILKKLKYRNK